MDEGPALQAIAQGFVEPYGAAKSPNYNELLPEFQDKWGPSISMQCIGIAYNPETITTPPTSWDDLWKPEYAGKVGITFLASTLATAFLVDIAPFRFGISDVAQHYHLPTKVSPWGFSIFWGGA